MEISTIILPYDIIRQISLYCKPKTITINRELSKMYNDIWFYDKLSLDNPGIKLYTSTNYEDLYKKYVKQGIITYYYCQYKDSHRLHTKGFKIIYHYEDNSYYILTFNCNLYKEIGNTISLIDTEVIDIDRNTYIKAYELYVYNGIKFIKHNLIPGNHRLEENNLIVPNQKFIKVAYFSHIPLALTSEGIYYYDNNLIDYHLINNATDLISEHALYIINNKLYTYYIGTNRNLVFQSYNLFNYKSGMGKFNNNDEPVFRFVSNEYPHGSPYRPIRTSISPNSYIPKYIQKHIQYDDKYGLIILSNRVVYIYQTFNGLIDELFMIVPDALNIYQEGNILFIITSTDNS